MRLSWRIGWDVVGKGGKFERSETLSSEDRSSYRVDEVTLGGDKVGVPCVVHAEALNDREWYVSVAGRRFWIRVGSDDVPRIVREEGP